MNDKDIEEIQKIVGDIVKFAIEKVRSSNLKISEENIIQLSASISSSSIFNLWKNIKFSNRIENKLFFAKVMWSTNKNIYKLVESFGIDTGQCSMFLKNIKKENQ